MNKTPSIASSPHISAAGSTATIMLDVLIALLPAFAASIFYFGLRAALVTGVCVASCVGFEALWCLLNKKPLAIKDLSAAVTGVLLAFNLPASIPLWQAVVGSLVAIIVIKQLFGGIGCNFVNPALAGRVVMALSFTGAMVNYSYPLRTLTSASLDALSSATPLAVLASEEGASSLSALSLFLGEHGGVLGETSCAALLLGGIYLCGRGVIKPLIPLCYIGSTFIFSWMFGNEHPLLFILSGGLFLGAIFMATDYVTSPYTAKGKLIYALGCGLLTALIRMFAGSGSGEGVSYSILLMNLVVPYINDLTRSKPYGTEVQRNEAR
ncbi:MAG: RnfABCDGE type electron transport complex subunit D [Oscillospiraceae bacterium]|nr:RnfABCDGE type electron transport complex subunit D [Oscillospiraceae bacterium]